MVMSHSDVVELARDVLIPGWQLERARLDILDRWWRWNPEQISLPRKSEPEARELRDLAESPWFHLLVTTIAQQLFMESVRSTEVDDTTMIWKPWQRNRFPARQMAVYRAALAYGYSYATAMPGDNGAVLRGRSPRDMFATYQDVIEDEYPAYYIIVAGNRYTVVDEDAKYTLVDADGRLQYVDHEVHGLGVAPAVRYSNDIDLEGRTPGEIEPLIKVAKRHNKTVYDRLLTQHYNSWKVRTATGLSKPDNHAEGERIKLLLRQSDILTGEEGVQFGSLDETSLEPFIRAGRDDKETFAAIGQIPTHGLTGDLINLSADAITEARATLDRKAGDRKVSFGDSNTQLLRLSSFVEGRERDAEDFTLASQFADFESRSLSQSADALGKISSQLGVPPEKLWDRIPTVTADEAQSWLKYKQDHPSADVLLAGALDRQANGTNS